MDILKDKPLECPNCKIDILNGLSEFIANGEIVCPHCSRKIKCSNPEEAKNNINELHKAIDKFRKTIKSLRKK